MPVRFSWSTAVIAPSASSIDLKEFCTRLKKISANAMTAGSIAIATGVIFQSSVRKMIRARKARITQRASSTSWLA